MQFSHVPPLLILEYVTPLLSVCPCHCRVTCVLTLIGLRVVAIGSLEVLLSGLVDTSHLSVKKSQFRGMGLKSGRVHMPSQTVLEDDT